METTLYVTLNGGAVTNHTVDYSTQLHPVDGSYSTQMGSYSRLDGEFMVSLTVPLQVNLQIPFSIPHKFNLHVTY